MFFFTSIIFEGGGTTIQSCLGTHLASSGPDLIPYVELTFKYCLSENSFCSDCSVVPDSCDRSTAWAQARNATPRSFMSSCKQCYGIYSHYRVSVSSPYSVLLPSQLKNKQTVKSLNQLLFEGWIKPVNGRYVIVYGAVMHGDIAMSQQ